MNAPNSSRRRLALALVALPASTLNAWAQTFPQRPVKIVVGFAPGGANDIVARLIATALTNAWGRPVTVENRPGANGAIALQQVARSAPDGYTLALGSSGPTTMNQALQKLPFDVMRDFTPIVNLVDAPHALAVNAALPVQTLKEFIDYARRTPGGPLNYSSPGVGNSGHFAMELLKQMAGIRLSHVAYKGAAPALNDLIAGHVQAYFTSVAAVLPHAGSGTLKVLAVTSQRRLSALPNVPTMQEAGFSAFQMPVYAGLLGPAGLSPELVTTINGAANAALRTASFLKALELNALEPWGGSSEEFRQFLANDLAKWTLVVKTGGIKPE